MTAPKRLPPWHEHFRLPNGRELLIRPIRPEDAIAPDKALVPSVQKVNETRVQRGFWPKIRRRRS